MPNDTKENNTTQVLPEIYKDFPDEIKNNLVFSKASDISKFNLPYVKYSLGERILRSLLGVLLFPITLFRTRLIKEDEIGFLLNNGRTELLSPGWHTQLSPTTEFLGSAKVYDPYIKAGRYKILNVPYGQLAIIYETTTGKYKYMTPGCHYIDSPTMIFDKWLDPNQSIVEIGTFEEEIIGVDKKKTSRKQVSTAKFVRIETGSVGIVSEMGKLKTVNPGLHFISAPAKFENAISTKQQTIDLKDLAEETQELVPLKVDADVYFTIKNPLLAVSRIKDVLLTIKELAISTLTGIIRNSSLSDIGQNSKAAYRDISNTALESKSDSTKPSTPADSYYNRVHDTFLKELNTDSVRENGIEFNDIKIKSLTVTDEKLAKDISSQALAFAKMQTELTNLNAEATIKARKAEMNKNTSQNVADASAFTIIATAKANAQAMREMADAERYQLEQQGIAHANYAEQVGKTPLGRDLALANAQSKTVGGIQKIVYLPSSGLPPILSAANFGGLFTPEREVPNATTNNNSSGHVVSLNQGS